MVPEEKAGSGEKESKGSAASPPASGATEVPKRTFVGGRWVTAEELATEREQLARENAELKGRLEGAATKAAPSQFPPWVDDLIDKGVSADVIAQLLQQPQTDVREVIRDELSKLAQQGKQQMSAAESIKAQFVDEHPEFDESVVQRTLSSDPVARDTYNELQSNGKYAQALDYIWAKSISTGGRKVNERARSQGQLPASRVVQTREESTTEGGDLPRPKVATELVKAAQAGGDSAIREYMRARRRGTALDLDADAPEGWTPSR